MIVKFLNNKKFMFGIKIVICLLVVVLAALFIFHSCSSSKKSTADDTYGVYEVADGRKKYQPEDKGSNDVGYIKFAGYGQYEVSKNKPEIELSNPDVNFADFVFTVKDSESKELIGKTGKVAPGKFVYMDVLDFYKTPGVYNVDINITTYDSETGAQLNGVNQKMEIIVK